MNLATKTGDRGETGLIGGTRVAKDDARVAAYGDVDELNAVVGCVAVIAHDDWVASLHAIQSDLFVLGAQLAVDERTQAHLAITDDHVARLDALLHELEIGLPELTNFVLPGGCELAARFHWARTVCRRAERSVVALSHTIAIDVSAIVYLNRLSDTLFAFALVANQRAGVDDIIWKAP